MNFNNDDDHYHHYNNNDHDDDDDHNANSRKKIRNEFQVTYETIDVRLLMFSVVFIVVVGVC